MKDDIVFLRNMKTLKLNRRNIHIKKDLAGYNIKIKYYGWWHDYMGVYMPYQTIKVMYDQLMANKYYFL